MKCTYQPKTRQRARTCGYRVRAKYSPQVLKRRRLKGRYRLTTA